MTLHEWSKIVPQMYDMNALIGYFGPWPIAKEKSYGFLSLGPFRIQIRFIENSRSDQPNPFQNLGITKFYDTVTPFDFFPLC